MNNDTDRDLIVPPPIPFADITVSEIDCAADILGVSPDEVAEDVQAGANPIQTNPSEAYDRFFIPIGALLKVKFNTLNEVAYRASVADTTAKLLSALDGLADAVEAEDGQKLTAKGNKGGSAYRNAIAKMRAWLKDPIGIKPPYTIFAKGNKKLPFWAFSTLPDVTCPGAGDCLKDPSDPTGKKRGWCYSFSAWRNVTPYFRQLQNTLLIRLEDKSWIEAEARKKFKPGQVVRLYVDGDMDSLKTLEYWMHFCERFPKNQFYGYSKSWGIFSAWHTKHGGLWPSNYKMNLSSGTSLERIQSPEVFRGTVRKMLSLINPKTGHRLVRGTFRALEVKSEFPKKADFERNKTRRAFGIKREGARWRKGGTYEKWNAHKTEVEAKARELGIRGDFGAKGVFVCPGYCGECLPKGEHACGSSRFDDMAIVIGIH